MRIHVARLIVSACALLALWLVSTVAGVAAPRAAELGLEAQLAEPSGGYVGRLKVAPEHGPAGTPLTVTAEGLPPEQEFDLVWRTVKGSWKVADAEYHGRDYRPIAYRIATVKTDTAGRATAIFTAPEDYGFNHDIVLQQGSRLYTQTGFNLDMTVRITPESGPVGTPITVEVKGIGWRHLQNSYVLLYDNNFTGWISTVTTGGSATFTIPATGKPGVHVLELLHADFTFAYRNMQQSPEPDRPRFALQFRITPGAPVLPPPPERQAQTSVRGLPAPSDLVVTPPFSLVDQPVVVSGSGFEPGKTYQLNWTTVTGNRVAAGGGGWEESSRSHCGSSGELRRRGGVRLQDTGRSRRVARPVGRCRRYEEDRDSLDRAKRISSRCRPWTRRHHVQDSFKGRRLDRDRQHLHGGLR